MLWLLSSLAMAAAPCGPELLEAPAQLSLRGHDYQLIGACVGLPVYRSAVTDSTFLDRAEAPFPLVLVTEESREPTTSDEDGWPAPRGNLYLSAPHPGAPEEARQALSLAVNAWLATEAPGVAFSEGWDGLYGAHRGPDGRFVSGLVVEARGEGSAMGLDLHLNASEAQYQALGAGDEHSSLCALLGRPLDVDAALWSLLPRLLAAPAPGGHDAAVSPSPAGAWPSGAQPPDAQPTPAQPQ